MRQSHSNGYYRASQLSGRNIDLSLETCVVDLDEPLIAKSIHMNGVYVNGANVARPHISAQLTAVDSYLRNVVLVDDATLDNCNVSLAGCRYMRLHAYTSSISMDSRQHEVARNVLSPLKELHLEQSHLYNEDGYSSTPWNVDTLILRRSFLREVNIETRHLITSNDTMLISDKSRCQVVKEMRRVTCLSCTTRI